MVEAESLVKNLGRTLRVARETKQLNLRSLGKLAGIPFSSISRWENDASALTVRDLVKLANALRVSPTQLIELSE